jgi:hypothetical protein
MDSHTRPAFEEVADGHDTLQAGEVRMRYLETLVLGLHEPASCQDAAAPDQKVIPSLDCTSHAHDGIACWVEQKGLPGPRSTGQPRTWPAPAKSSNPVVHAGQDIQEGPH